MRKSFLLIVSLIVFAQSHMGFSQGVLRKESRNQPSLDWRFDTRRLKDDQPDTKVYLIVNGRSVFLLRALSQFTVLEQGLYKTHNVPRPALTACAGWWAGQGQDLYVIRRKGQLVVYIRYLDEQAPVPAFGRLKVIPLRR